MRSPLPPLLVAAAVALLALPAHGQQPGAAPAASAADSMPRVGDLAPDFTIRGATRFGLLQNPIRLSDFRGSTVVLSFFPAARTKG